ncbi:MAG: nucleotidyltransferase [Chthoniobacterales bacterium]
MSATATLPKTTEEFYRRTIETLREAEIPFMVAGAYAFGVYTGITRHTKDLDFFLRPSDVECALEHFRSDGFETERTFPHWLAKVKCGEDCLDLIYRAGNGRCEIDDSWFERAREDEVLGCRAFLCAPEDMLWMKSYIMERERFDGADVVHLIQSCAERLDWGHLVRRFDRDWRVLLSHLVLFGYIYPAERHRIPASTMSELLQWAQEETTTSAPNERICRGTLLSREQYLPDVQERGYSDARLDPESHMSEEDIALWTAAIESKE